jgi:hypothetical protein
VNARDEFIVSASWRKRKKGQTAWLRFGARRCAQAGTS